MPVFEANPRPVPPKNGVKISLRHGPGGPYVSLTISADMQERAFGRRLEKGEPVILSLNTDKGRTHALTIMPNGKGAIQVGGGVRGSVKLEAAPWRGCTEEERKPAACPPLAAKNGALAVRLPDWAQPTPDPR